MCVDIGLAAAAAAGRKLDRLRLIKETTLTPGPKGKDVLNSYSVLVIFEGAAYK